MLNEAQLRQAAGDYVAGDLDREDAAAFERLLAGDVQLQREVAFWRRLRAGLATEPTAPAPLLAERLRRQRSQRRRHVAWAAGIATTTAAAGLVAGIALAPHVRATHACKAEPPPPGTLAWFEDGSAVVMPAASRQLWKGSYLPLAVMTTVPVGLAAPAAAGHHEAKPWLGIWTRPVHLIGVDDGDDDGHLVVRVAEGSPAAIAGIAPGDVITRLADCRVMTPQCIARFLAMAHPGERTTVTFRRTGTAGKHTVDVTLSGVLE